MLRDTARDFGEVNELVIKPQVSAGSDRTLRIALNSSSLSTIESTSPMMIQPFLESICSEEELSVYIFGGKVSHSIVKHPAKNDFRAILIFGGHISTIHNPTDEMLNVISTRLTACPVHPIYARIDMARDNSGVLHVMELEIIEPFLCLHHASGNGLSFVRVVLNEC
ncbi:unnamed protein product [Rotaria sp. Silwood2]|nr:unnamed protein product [Rotaria sp. Silwood2]CAF3087360.1 unnamed protein product [Rotaria sp. Silwood2]CAF3131439.1 unnamed protein product [Rotaria sp. Silwood2]CAF4210450.1 unnamed protein product [Rotaria sp. Silwood2]CAF4240795.1 unnamed protein product [Rotaria sp. Silwood2]